MSVNHEAYQKSVEQLVMRDAVANNLHSHFQEVMATLPPKEAATWILAACCRASTQLTRLHTAAVAAEHREKFAGVYNNVQNVANGIVRNHDLY